jgi:S-formylglutathione hydrolase FrmB
MVLSAFSTARAADIDTVFINSVSMQRLIPCLVIKPAQYDTARAPYPVLYLLHGWSGHFAGWLRDAPQLTAHADHYQTLIVCPDGGYDSWYLDSPIDSSVRYATHIAQEVVQFIDFHYHTRRNREGRAIAGLSMGGHGAIYLSARFPEQFGAAGSLCGGLDLRPFQKNNWDLQGVLGSPSTHWQQWEAHSVVNLAPVFKEQKVELAIDCGLDDFFLETNRTMHRILLENNIDHTYTERPGEHNGAYWGSVIDEFMVFFNRFFKRSGEK